MRRRINPHGLLALETDKATEEGIPAVVPPAAADPATAQTTDDAGLSKIVIDDHPEDPVIDHSDDVETDLAETQEASSEVEGMEEATQDAVEVASALESIRDVLSGSLYEGGISRSDAIALKPALEALAAGAGTGVKFPAPESFETVSGRLRATRLAIESISETAGKIWDAIVRAIKAAVQWLKERFQMLFLSSEKLKRRAIEIQTRAKAAQQDPKNTVFKNSTLAQALHVSGKVNAVGAASDLEHLTGRLFRADIEKAYEGACKLAEGQQVHVENDILAHIFGVMSEMKELSNAEAEGLHKPDSVDLVKRSAELPGGKALVAYIASTDAAEKEKKWDEYATRVTKTQLALTDFSSKTKVEGDQELATLKSAEIEKVCQAVVQACDEMDGFKTVTAGIERVLENTAKAIEKAAKEVKGDDDESKRNRAAARIVPWALRTINTPITGLAYYVLITSKHLLDYCTVSMKEMEGKASEAAKTTKEDKVAETAAA